MICRNHVDVSEGVRRCMRCGGTYCADCLVAIQDQPYCATCKTEQLLDMQSGVVASATSVPLRYAGFWSRFAALFLDGLIIYLPAAIIAVAFEFVAEVMRQGQAGELFSALGYVPIYVFPMVYEGLMLSSKNGQTIGKMALRLRVVQPDGSPVTAPQAWRRALVRLVVGLVCLNIVDYLAFFVTDEKKTLHDMAAETRVVEVS